jgi:hypothetical protein
MRASTERSKSTTFHHVGIQRAHARAKPSSAPTEQKAAPPPGKASLPASGTSGHATVEPDGKEPPSRIRSRCRGRTLGGAIRGSDLGILEDEAETVRRPALAADLQRAADPAVDEVAHGKADVRLVGRDSGGDEPIAQRGSVGRRGHFDGHDGLARQRDAVDGGLTAGAKRAGFVRPRSIDVEVRDGAAVAHEERAAVLERTVQVDDRPAVLDAIRRLEDEAAVGRHRGRISMMAESAPVGLVPE